MQYFPEYEGDPNLTVIKGDVRDLSAVKAAVGDATLVFHLAAIAGVSKYFRIPGEVMEINVIGTYNILEAVRNNKNIRALFDFSTSEIYGSNCFSAAEDGDVKMENMLARRWTYATSKIASEKFGMSYFWQYGVPFIGIRPFNIYGPGQVGEGVISYFLNNCIERKPLKITGDGTQSRTYCYITDFIEGLDLILNKLDFAIGSSFNVGTSTEIYSVHSLAKLVTEITGFHAPIEYVEHQGDDVMVRSPNINRLKSIGYTPKVSLRDGLRNTYEWYASRKVALD